jgi:hypothetical protein
MIHHAIERTSPKGGPFIGTCRKCGRAGLTVADFFRDECPNIRETTPEQDLLEAIDPVAPTGIIGCQACGTPLAYQGEPHYCTC